MVARQTELARSTTARLDDHVAVAVSVAAGTSISSLAAADIFSVKRSAVCALSADQTQNPAAFATASTDGPAAAVLCVSLYLSRSPVALGSAIVEIPLS